ncbi:MAG TPA: DUF3135 domain-containing protein [Gammaproteobacteria bacterium]|nr:DUF3135 domain-containing protein [Gammaproteobacteria bacterium]
MDTSQQFDFDAWAELAKSDPAAFERQRIDAIEEFLQQVPLERRQRLRCLQWRIDHTRERAANPMSACLRISQMMWDSLLGNGGLLEALERLRRPCAPAVPPPRAKVLDFRQHGKD